MITLKNQTTTCDIDLSQGCYVRSLRDSSDGVGDVLFTSNEVKGGMPFMFPFAGRVWYGGQEGFYKLGESILNMPLHGFNETLKFDIDRKTEHQASCVFEGGPFENYPFPFRINHVFELEPHSLNISTKISNLDSARPMPAAVGWHPYFNVPALQSYLNVEAKSVRAVSDFGAALENQVLPQTLTRCELSEPRWHNLILTDLQNCSAILQHKDVRFRMSASSAFKHIVLWTSNPDKFFCVEPWMALPDGVHRDAVWLKKDIEFALKLSW